MRRIDIIGKQKKDYLIKEEDIHNIGIVLAKDLKLYFKYGGTKEELTFDHMYEVISEHNNKSSTKVLNLKPKEDITIPYGMLNNREVRDYAQSSN